MGIKIELGMTQVAGTTPTAAMLDVEQLISTRLLIQGNSGSGKSHLLRRILEQSAAHVQQVVVDPEGDFVSLGPVFGHVVIDANRSPTDLTEIARRIRSKRVSCILDLSGLDVTGQLTAAAIFINAMFDVDREWWFPVLVAVDEVQLFAPSGLGEAADENEKKARQQSLAALTNLMCRGRKRGMCGVIATQRLAKIAKNVAAEATNVLMGRTFLDIDVERAADLLGMSRRQAELFKDLNAGTFLGLGPALAKRPVTIGIGAVQTKALGATPELTPPPERPGDDELGDLLAAAPVAIAPRPERRAPEPAVSTPDLFEAVAREAARAQPDLPDIREETPEDLAARERLMYALAIETLSEEGASFQPEATLFQSFVVRCRIRRIAAAPKPSDFKRYLDAARAGVDPETATGADWARAAALAQSLDDDMRPIFLVVAAAAMRGAPCPSDATLADTCGVRSASRARIRLSHLDRMGLVVLRTDMKKHRIANMPDLGWETAAGDPDAPAVPLQAIAAE